MRWLPLCALVFLVGCFDRGQARDQAAADGHEGVEAMIQVAPQTEPIGRGVQNNFLASRGKTNTNELPRPQMRAAEIAENPSLYQQQSQQNIRRGRQMGTLALLGLGALASVVTALKASGFGGPLMHWVGGLLDNSKQRDQNERLVSEARVGRRMVRIAEELPPETGKQIKQAVSHAPDHQPEDERAIRSILKETA